MDLKIYLTPTQIHLKEGLGITLAFLILTGCPTQLRSSALERSRKSRHGGVIHVVQKGQTLWNISKTYDIPLQAILAANHLKRHNEIRVGQKLWIPGARKVLSVPPTCPPSAPPPKLSWPVYGTVIRKFGPYGLQRSEGIDIQAPLGTPVKAAAHGQVIYAGNHLRGYEKVIIIQHDNGYSTVYANNSENLIKESAEVHSGQIIARVGCDGKSEIPYLHFEIRYHQKALDPISFLP